MTLAKPTVLSLLAALSLGASATIGGTTATAVTRLHDPVLGHSTIAYGATNGDAIHRGPWVVQIAVAKDEFLYVRVDPEAVGGSTALLAIGGNGHVYFGRPHSLGSADLCLLVEVTGWMTVHIDTEAASPSEHRLKIEYSRSTGCGAVAPPH